MLTSEFTSIPQQLGGVLLFSERALELFPKKIKLKSYFKNISSKLLDIHACFSKYHKRPDLDQQTAKCCKKVGLECGVDPTAHPTKRYSCLSGTDAAPKGEKKKIDEFKKCCFLMPRADRNPAQGVTYNRSSSTPTKACEPTSVNTEK